MAYIASAPIGAKKSPYFPSAQLPSGSSSIYKIRKPPTIDSVNVVATRSPVEIFTRRLIKKEKSLYQPVTATVFPNYKLPASLSSIFVPRKK